MRQLRNGMLPGSDYCREIALSRCVMQKYGVQQELMRMVEGADR